MLTIDSIHPAVDDIIEERSVQEFMVKILFTKIQDLGLSLYIYT